MFTTLTHLAEALDTASYPGLVRQRLRRYTTPSVLVIDEVVGAKARSGEPNTLPDCIEPPQMGQDLREDSHFSQPGWG